MTGRATKTRAGARGASPVLALPPDTDAKTRRKLARLVDLQLAQAQGKPVPQARPFRFRFHLVPLCWLAAGLAGLAMRAGHTNGWLAAVLALATAAITAGATRERKRFTRHYNQGMAAWSAAWALVFLWAGSGWWTAAWLAGWAVPSFLWWERYRWRPQAAPAVPDTSVEDTWRKLCEAQRWDATLGTLVTLDGGGAQYPVRCDGITTHIGKITPKRDEVAAAFHKAITEVYVEPDPSGIKSHGLLTVLPRGSLDIPRLWDGCGVDLATGLALVGRFPDGAPVRERYFVRGVGGGAKHTIIAGCDGSGKTGLIDMGLCISAATGIIAPVILDPQEGQALPAWRDHLPYAAGAEDCMTYLRGLHAAMYDRSAHLSQLRWMHPKSHRMVTGFGFFDYWMIADARRELGLPPLPIIEVTIDEAAVLLAMKGAPALLLDIAKLGRKVGFRLRLALQVPSIAEMGKGELRSILVGGNVFCFRTGDKVSNGMANIPANPNELPKFWSNGTPTVGLGFAATGDAAPRPSVTMRTDYTDDPYSYAEDHEIRQPDADVAERLAATVAVAAQQVREMADAQATGELLQAEILKILAGRPMTPGQVISQTTYPVSAVVEALEALETDGKISKAGDMIQAVA